MIGGLPESLTQGLSIGKLIIGGRGVFACEQEVLYVYVYIYIYIERERDTTYIHIYIYIYIICIYIYIYREREREMPFRAAAGGRDEAVRLQDGLPRRRRDQGPGMYIELVHNYVYIYIYVYVCMYVCNVM